jgi:flagellar hook-associated protein 3 FlgL
MEAANSVTSRLTVIDTALSDIVETVTQARSTALSARGTGRTPLEREAAAQALIGLRDQVFDALNTQFRGVYVFAGTASSTAPYSRDAGGNIVGTYNGTADENQLDVDMGRSVKVTYNGESLAKGSATDDIFTVFDDLIAEVRSGSSDGIGNGEQALKGAFERISTVQTAVGTQMQGIEQHKVRLGEVKLLAQTQLDSAENVDLAAAITGMTQAEAAYRAALGAASKTNSVSLMDFVR